MDLEELAELVQDLKNGKQSQAELRLSLMSLQQVVAEMLALMTKQGPMMADAVREGLAGVSIKAPAINFQTPPAQIIQAPAEHASEPPEEKCGWEVRGIEYLRDGRLKNFHIVPMPRKQ